MTTYTIHKTDITEAPITVSEDIVITDVFDISLIGQFKTNYGTEVNENMLNILENFACPEALNPDGPEASVPDLTAVSNTQLHRPTNGQFWYNSTRGLIYYWNGSNWINTPKRNQYAANWGMVNHGEQLPKPVAGDGRVFDYPECIWSVSPAVFVAGIDTFNCNTDADANVFMRYRYAGTETMVDGIANYLIIGIDENENQGPSIRPTPIIVSPTPSPTATLTPTPTATVTPSVTTSITPSITATITPSVTSSATPTPTRAPTPTPTPVPSMTPTPSNVPVTYCWSTGQICMGFTAFDPGNGDTQGFLTLRKNSVTSDPAPGSCVSSFNGAASCFGLIYWSHPVMYTHPAIQVQVTIRGSNGQQNTQTLVFSQVGSSSESYRQETLTQYINVGGVNVPVVALVTWNKRAGNRNAADGTISVQLSFPNTTGRCS